MRVRCPPPNLFRSPPTHPLFSFPLSLSVYTLHLRRFLYTLTTTMILTSLSPLHPNSIPSPSTFPMHHAALSLKYLNSCPSRPIIVLSTAPVPLRVATRLCKKNRPTSSISPLVAKDTEPGTLNPNPPGFQSRCQGEHCLCLVAGSR